MSAAVFVVSVAVPFVALGVVAALSGWHARRVAELRAKLVLIPPRLDPPPRPPRAR